jgi:hypothetical protein
LAVAGAWALATGGATHRAALAHKAAALEINFLEAMRLRWTVTTSCDIGMFSKSYLDTAR